MLQKKVKVLVLRTAGINCEAEMMVAWEKAGAAPELRHINEIAGAEASEKLERYAALAIPGGFAYGDDLGAGKLLANDLLYRLQEPFARFVEAGKPVLGVCNGFQVLAKSGLFGEVTLLPNRSGRFECRWSWLQNAGGNNCLFTKGIEQIYLPVAHGEGRVMVGGDNPATTLKNLEENGQVVLKYTNPEGAAVEYPYNPNGSVADIAGICNPSGTVFGLMPHPERFISPLQHPRWTRLQGHEGGLALTEGEGLKIFKNAVAFASQA
ncbi:MAG: phosphoribosylformylglycinamidine synthase I [Chloroflexota bacterium]|nr:phosphoribosylformylglycinamidine synthase I [Chloroflexota bacterium]